MLKSWLHQNVFTRCFGIRFTVGERMESGILGNAAELGILMTGFDFS